MATPGTDLAHQALWLAVNMGEFEASLPNGGGIDERANFDHVCHGDCVEPGW